MKRLALSLAIAPVLLATGAFSAAQGPANEDARIGGVVVEARILVKQLEAQVESQRAALRQTEANLEQARALLTALEGGTPSETKRADLRAPRRDWNSNLKKPGDSCVRTATRPSFI